MCLNYFQALMQGLKSLQKKKKKKSGTSRGRAAYKPARMQLPSQASVRTPAARGAAPPAAATVTSASAFDAELRGAATVTSGATSANDLPELERIKV